jgi:hypothetical protein
LPRKKRKRLTHYDLPKKQPTHKDNVEMERKRARKLIRGISDEVWCKIKEMYT